MLRKCVSEIFATVKIVGILDPIPQVLLDLLLLCHRILNP